MTEAGDAQPGWYPDPDDPSELRYFDGTAWTDHLASSMPPPEPLPAPEPHPTAGDGFGPVGYWKFAIIENNHRFKGRARRAEFWWTMIISFIALWAVAYAAFRLQDPELITVLSIMYMGLLVPSLAVAVRRLHDVGRSGFWLLVYLVPLVGIIALLVFFLTDGDRGPNRFGPSPKYAAAAAVSPDR